MIFPSSRIPKQSTTANGLEFRELTHDYLAAAVARVPNVLPIARATDQHVRVCLAGLQGEHCQVSPPCYTPSVYDFAYLGRVAGHLSSNRCEVQLDLGFHVSTLRKFHLLESQSPFPVGSDVQGSVNLDYRQGGPNGTVVDPDAADYVHISTLASDNQPGLMIESPLGGQIFIIADIMANITDGPPESATIITGSNGQMLAGDYSATFEISGVTVYESDYPIGGPVTFDNGTHQLTFMFNGTAEVLIALDDVDRWVFNLDTLVFGPVS